MIAHPAAPVRVCSQEMLLDGITPIAAYAALSATRPGPSFLLESAPGAGQLARYSIIGLGAAGELIAAEGEVTLSVLGEQHRASDVLEAARMLMAAYKPQECDPALAPFLGAYGIAAFEFASYFECVGLQPRGEDCVPDLHLIVPRSIVIFDHYTHRVTRAMLVRDEESPEDEAELRALLTARISPLATRSGRLAPLSTCSGRLSNRPVVGECEVAANVVGDWKVAQEVELSPATGSPPFTAMVEQAKAAIVAGDVFQIVLSQVWRSQVADPFSIYRILRSINPSPYMFYLDLGPQVLLGSSPEMLCKLEGRTARLRPLAGTRPRPADPQRESEVARQLLRDPKERAEHVMLVDLGRNDLGRVCEYGSVQVSELFAIERYSHVMHLVSEVRGTLRAPYDALDLFAATFPAGTVSGAPKIRAMQLIAQIEGRRRGYYGGSVVRFGLDGSLDACIVLRSACVRGGVASVTAGAGIVADSQAASEDAECRAKARAVVQALQATGELAS